MSASPFTGAPPSMGEMYEKHLVPSLFKPWAELLIQRADPRSGESVIDIACGTGIVARLAKEKVGTNGKVVGVDVSPLMLGVARTTAHNIEWREGNAMALPADEGEQFNVVFCHQGLQFVPDRAAAAREMRRVIAPGGRLVAAVWATDEGNAFLSGLKQVAERHVGPIKDSRHSFADADALRALIADAGFQNVSVESLTRTVRFANGELFVRMNAMALIGMSAKGKELSEAERAKVADAIVQDSSELLRANSDGHGLRYELGSNIASARG